MKIRNLITLAVIFFTTSLANNLSVTVGNYVGNADNFFNSNLITEQSFGNNHLSLEYLLNENIVAFADIDHSAILSDFDYTAGEFNIGFQYRNFSQKDRQLFGGINFFKVFYSDSYSYYNNNKLNAYLTWKYYLKASQIIKLDYDISINIYPEIEELSNTTHYLKTSFNQSFKTKTSLFLSAQVGVQDYWAIQQINSNGSRRHFNFDIAELPSNYLLITTVGFSQSLAEHIGIGTNFYQNVRLNGKSSDFEVVNDDLVNPLLDEFHYEGFTFSTKLTWNLPHHSSLFLSGFYQKRDYRETPVYAYDFELEDYLLIDEQYVLIADDRSDKQTSYQIEFIKDWYFPVLSRAQGVSTIFTWSRNINISNDPIYDYTGNTFSAGFNISF